MNTYKPLALFIITTLLAGGCNQLFATPTPTPLPTNTPTLTSTSTTTPTPTFTPSPTVTPTPNGQVINLLGMELLAPLDWQVNIEEEDSQITAEIKEPDSGVTLQFMSIDAKGMDDTSQCSVGFMQPLFAEMFKQMIPELETEKMDDLLLTDGSAMSRSALVGQLIGILDFRIEIGVLLRGDICYASFLSGEKGAIADNQNLIDDIFQSIEFMD
jgi:hypothetical protein